MIGYAQVLIAHAALVAALLFGGTQAQSAVWENTATWSSAWQDRFSQWVASDDVHIEMALRAARNQDYRNVEMDCADFIYYLHAVFAFEHRLDFAIHTRSGQRLTNQTKQFDSIAGAEARFKRFLQFVLEQTNTKTLQHDSVLLPVSQNEIRSGSFLITDRSKNHVWLIKTIKASGTPVLLSATVPASNFIYPAFTFPVAESAFTNVAKVGYLSINHGGFRRLRWPEDKTAASTEQTQIPLTRYFETIATALRNTVAAAAAVSPSDKLDGLLDETCLQLRIRTNLITDAMSALAGAASLTPSQADQLSTKSRDHRIRDLIAQTRNLVAGNRASLNNLAIEKYHRLFEVDLTLSLDYNSAEAYCFVQWAENRIEPAAAIIDRFEQPGRISPNATDSLEARWGEGR